MYQSVHTYQNHDVGEVAVKFPVGLTRNPRTLIEIAEVSTFMVPRCPVVKGYFCVNAI
jgi:hypothetical protein